MKAKFLMAPKLLSGDILQLTWAFLGSYEWENETIWFLSQCNVSLLSNTIFFLFALGFPLLINVAESGSLIFLAPSFSHRLFPDNLSILPLSIIFSFYCLHNILLLTFSK